MVSPASTLPHTYAAIKIMVCFLYRRKDFQRPQVLFQRAPSFSGGVLVPSEVGGI